jgi:hypothetical protein
MATISKKIIKAWVVSVDMGYGHQRASDPLRCLAHQGKIISANQYPGIPAPDKRLWHESRRFYEFISRFKRIPIVGEKAWKLYDNLQEIPSFYPKRDLSKLSMQLRQIYYLIEKKDWGKHLIEQLSKKPIPFVTTFFIPAFMAEHFGYPGEIYCLATDTDINRAWAPKYPAKSRIQYFAPNLRVVERLKLYGVPVKNIHFTGFPLPLENTGVNLEIVKKDMVKRLINLDPKRAYWNLHHPTITKYLGIKRLSKKSDRPLTIMYAVGGAGAQREIGGQILKSLAKKIKAKEVKVILVAGVNQGVGVYFRQAARKAGLRAELNKGVEVIYEKTKDEYFKQFNKTLRVTDILWTKPSELSFYTALGLPIVIAPPIGSQEEFNRKWLRTIGSAASQDDPRYTHEWLFDWLDSGWLAEAAMEGFMEAPKYGTYNVAQVIAHRTDKAKFPKMTLQY